MPKVTFSSTEIDELNEPITELQNCARGVSTAADLDALMVVLQNMISWHNKLETILQAHYDFIVKLIELDEQKGGDIDCQEKEQTD